MDVPITVLIVMHTEWLNDLRGLKTKESGKIGN
jgi:hypothetical protein